VIYISTNDYFVVAKIFDSVLILKYKGGGKRERERMAAAIFDIKLILSYRRERAWGAK